MKIFKNKIIFYLSILFITFSSANTFAMMNAALNYVFNSGLQSQDNGGNPVSGGSVTSDSLLQEESAKRKRDGEHWQQKVFAHSLAQDSLTGRIEREKDLATKRLLVEQQTKQEEIFGGITQAAYRLTEIFANKEKALAESVARREIAKHEKDLVREKAAAEREGIVASAKVSAEAKIKAQLDFIRNNPKLIVGMFAAGALSFYAAKHGTAILADIIKQWYKTPTLAQETSILSYKEKLRRWIMAVPKEQSDVTGVILEPKLSKRIATLAEATKSTVKNETYFKNILFYGPPGTGKTMVAQRIARSSGLEYIYFAASSLDQFPLEEAVIKLTELFEYAKRSTKKLMIIIDEAEVLFASRDKKLSEKTRKMLTHVLTYTGTESKNFMIVALTNRPEDLDKAFLKRCDDRVEIGAPSLEQRKLILKKYFDEYLVVPSKQKVVKPSYLDQLLGRKAQPKFSIEAQALTKDFIDQIAGKLNNFVGRDISKLVLALQSAALTSHNRLLTVEMIDEIVDLKIAEEDKLSSGFKISK